MTCPRETSFRGSVRVNVMFELLPKLPLYRFYRLFGAPRMMPLNLTVSLTCRCNSRCRTCNIYEQKSDELSPDEYRRIFRSIGGAPYWITFSGGEPFLRDDIADICTAACEHTAPGIINIPTNGILSGRVEKSVRKIVEGCPGTMVIINLSVDAVGEMHDKIRGVKGSFEKAMETYSRLRSINAANLTLGIHTVISKYNVGQMPEIYMELKKLKPDSYITEIAEERVELGTMGSGISPDPDDYAAAVDFVTKDMKSWDMQGVSRITRAFRCRYYSMVKEILDEGRMIIPCYAGVASCQIAPDGKVWACCMRAEVMGDLKDADYDFKTVWFSDRARKVREDIKARNCFCTLANASYTNMLFAVRELAQVAAEVVFRR